MFITATAASTFAKTTRKSWSARAFSILTIWIYPILSVAEEINKNLKHGVVFKDCEVCPEMILVPNGLYIMGLGGKNRHGPPLRVVVNKPFAIGRYEIKFNEWFAAR